MKVSLKKLAKTVFLSGVMAVGILGNTVYTHASVDYLFTDECGNTYWYSTGSSGPDTVWRCPAGGGACTGYDPGIVINGREQGCSVGPIA
ncbi:MAG: hypothetical protein JOZ96_15840 [Acidobacteria bacterium]|nr:hypothetical protein [Acidobacteriota bacterium]